MRTVTLAVVVGFLAGQVVFGDDASDAARKEAVKQRAIQRAYEKRIAKEWEKFTARFVNRQVVPVYSGPYQIGTRMVVTPNYAAIRAYKNQLDLMAWNSMTDEQKRDLALFTIARNTGVIAANTGLIANNTGVIAANTGQIAQQNARIAEGVEDVARQLRQEAIDRKVAELFPR